MELRRIEIEKLHEAEYNPRQELQPGDPEFDKLKRSIEQFGEVEPIIWNETTGNVVGGHQRLAVLKYIGRTETTVSVVHLDEKSEKLLNVALNKIRGTWNREKLEDILSGFEPDDALLSGFDAQEITLMLAKNDDINEDFDFSFDGNEEDAEDDGYEAAPGTSYIVSLVFKTNTLAQEWAKDHGYKKAVKDGKKTTVIRME